ncbi:MAG: hypothetical protein EOM67_15155 [Spirochaetia bacterium]|nr:hypothetical protein [Spirochaetia bacterium]
MNKYEEAQELIEQARLLRGTSHVAAKALFLRAADIHRDFIRTLVDKPKTLGVYGLSAASLYVQAEELDKAESLIRGLLSMQITPYDKKRLKELLDSIAKV